MSAYFAAPKHPGYVYLVISKEQDCGKIGYCSQVPTNRLASMQTGNPHLLTLEGYIPGSRAVEGAIHKELAAYRKAREWFEPPLLLLCVLDVLHSRSMDENDEPIALTPAEAAAAAREGIAEFLVPDE